MALLVTTVLTGCAAVPIASAAGKTLGAWLTLDRNASNWTADYELAERRAQATHAPIAFCFTDSKFAARSAALRALHDPEVASRLHGYVRATLVKSFEPDRRYAEQFGVTRAPSLILVHPDGTFHAHTGAMTTAVLTKFLDESVPPGAVARRNPLLPREYKFDWMIGLDEAVSRSRETQTPMIVAYDRRLTGDWRHLKRLLSTREVGMRITGLIHCRVRLLPRTGDAFITPYGALQLPALVAVQPDGSYETIEAPTSSATVARRLEKFLHPTSAVSDSTRAVPTRRMDGDVNTNG